MKRNKISQSMIRQLLEEQNNRCNECKNILNEREGYNLDHLIPFSKGGTDLRNNLQLLCINCHNLKTQFDGFSSLVTMKKRDKMAICEKCGKVIHGFSNDHVEFLMMQHMLVHRRKTPHNALKPQDKPSKDDVQLNKNNGGK